MRLLLTAAIVMLFAIPANATHRHRHHAKQLGTSEASLGRGSSGGLVTITTAAGPIRVAAHLAGRFQALIADFVAHGYKPRSVHCHAHGGHVPNSRHYSGAACDFDQRGWGLTTSFMYQARAIIAKHGFRDGCSFNDCGHVDDGGAVRYAARKQYRPGVRSANARGQKRYYVRYARDDDDSDS
ncbi:hypothetical protein [Rhodomicrobium lacus]|uniref:hypothetical protein n=1 Tax=Rhodomicrobium TaxID=1068 RepID=UPI0026E2DFB5|nr:hypothetical protein [Rhodomicrobium lacus]WKW50875.1 hypothetical protein QMO75_16700 [Rhodomicrobium lacus]